MLYRYREAFYEPGFRIAWYNLGMRGVMGTKGTESARATAGGGGPKRSERRGKGEATNKGGTESERLEKGRRRKKLKSKYEQHGSGAEATVQRGARSA